MVTPSSRGSYLVTSLVRAVSWERLGRTRKTGDCFFSCWASIWAILSSAAARLVDGPSTSPNHLSRSASAILSLRLSRISSRRGFSSRETIRTGQRTSR